MCLKVSTKEDGLNSMIQWSLKQRLIKCYKISQGRKSNPSTLIKTMENGTKEMNIHNKQPTFSFISGKIFLKNIKTCKFNFPRQLSKNSQKNLPKKKREPKLQSKYTP